MNAPLLIAVQNTLIALVLALLVLLVTRVVRNPPLAHALWLLVLLKLVTPPVMAIHWPIRQSAGPIVSNGPPTAELDAAPPGADIGSTPQVAQQEPTDRTLHDGKAAEQVGSSPIVRAPTAPVRKTPIAAGDVRGESVSPADGWTTGTVILRQAWTTAAPVIFWCWVCGLAVCAWSAAARVVRFERAVRQMPPAPESLARLLRETAARLGVRRPPVVRIAAGVEVPLLWCLLRPTIVLPMRLTRELDEQPLAMILAHELAHLHRRDHWVRFFELIVAIVYWWNPLVWLVRRQVHQAEELCCDAWVGWAFPDERKGYAEVVLKAAESLNAVHVGRRLFAASPFLRCFSLKERIEMILESRFRPRVSLTSKFVITLAALVVLPTFVRFKREAAAQDEKPSAASVKTEPPDQSEFPHVVKFEQGVAKFLEGDKITIVEVRGTAETFKPGDIYWIKGTYSLASHDRATLAAYTTAKNAADGRSKSYRAQTTIVKKGSGTFTLFLPMACEGWPHVSFYPAEGGEGFGGNYFGTGESVLKRWWGSKEADTPAKESKTAEQSSDSRTWRAIGRVTDAHGQPLAGVEISALCGGPTPGRAGTATSGEDGRYELDFNPALGRARAGQPALQSTLISARKPGYFEENLNRQGGCVAASAMPDEARLKKLGHVAQDRVFLPDHPLEINFVMRPAARAAGRLVDEQGQPLVGYSVTLQGPDLSPASSVASDARTDEQGRFTLTGIPATFRYQFVVRKPKPKPPWNDSWASAVLRFDRPDKDGLRAWFGDHEVRAAELVLRVTGEGVHGRTATRIAGNAGALELTAANPGDVTEQSKSRLVAKSLTLTLSNAVMPDLSQALVRKTVSAAPAVAFATRLARTRPNEAGEFVISFQNPSGFDLVRGKHQVIFQVFVGASRRPIREKIFRQLDIEDGRYEVPVTISPELIDDSRVSITFVTVQPDHDAWVRAFFHEGNGTSYRGIWTSDGDMLPAVPFETP